MNKPDYYAHRIERSLADLPDDEHPRLHRGFLAETAATIRNLLAEQPKGGEPVFHLRSYGDVSASELEALASPAASPAAPTQESK